MEETWSSKGKCRERVRAGIFLALAQTDLRANVTKEADNKWQFS